MARMQDQVTAESRRNAIFCSLLVAAAILISYPVADVPFSDDFSYTKTALVFAQTGHFVYNGWATAVLGWQILWGALFIKLFGFSFTIVRLSSLPLAMASCYLFHQVLVRFGISPVNAALGTLTLALSPLFLMLEMAYMTDLPGVLVIVLCLYMCQRAVAAADDRTAVTWLVFAALLNIPGGTVRQTSWLAGLVMVPSTAWLLRRRCHMLPAGIILTIVSLFAAAAFMHWANHQPGLQLEGIVSSFRGIRGRLHHTLYQFARVFLVLLFVLLPLLCGWLPEAHKINRVAVFAILAAAAILGIISFAHAGQLELHNYAVPWSIPMLGTLMGEGSSLLVDTLNISMDVRLVLSIVEFTIGLFLIVWFVVAKQKNMRIFPSGDTWREALWLLVPFSLVYCVFLMPRAATSLLQDRYLLGIMPAAIVLILMAYQNTIGEKLPSISLAVLAIFTLYTIAGSHDFYANLRAVQTEVKSLMALGVPRSSISAGFSSDGWAQLEIKGEMNNNDTVEGAYVLNPAPWDVPAGCADDLPWSAEPEIHPTYFVSSSLTRCLVPTSMKPLDYSVWLPPFHRQVYIETAKPH